MSTGERCPDGGACNHECIQACYRVLTCGPLSGVYPGDQWPDEVVAIAGAGENRAEAERRKQGLDGISPGRWQLKSPVVTTVRLTETNWASIVGWLSAHGVHSSWSLTRQVLTFGGPRGSYSAPPGYWIVVYGKEDPGAEAWSDAKWQRDWKHI